MAKGYYLKQSDSVSGPMTVDQIREMASAGRISPDSLISTSAAGPWHPASRARGLEFAKAAPVAEGAPPTPPPLPTILPVTDTAPPPRRSAKLTGKELKAVILIGSVLLVCLIIGAVYAIVTKRDPTLEACVTCGKNVSAKAKVCPHCGEPNPSPSLRAAIAAEQARQQKERQQKLEAMLAEQTRRSEEERREREALKAVHDLEMLGPEFLTKDGREILQIGDQQVQARTMRELLDRGGESITAVGREVLATYNAAMDQAMSLEQQEMSKEAHDELIRQKLSDAFDILEKAKAAEAIKKQLALMPEAFGRLRKEIERLAKERGQLPDEDNILTIAFTGEMRDPWSLALKYKIIDAKEGKYLLSSAGPDNLYNTDDDPKLECQLGKP